MNYLFTYFKLPNWNFKIISKLSVYQPEIMHTPLTSADKLSEIKKEIEPSFQRESFQNYIYSCFSNSDLYAFTRLWMASVLPSFALIISIIVCQEYKLLSLKCIFSFKQRIWKQITLIIIFQLQCEFLSDI